MKCSGLVTIQSHLSGIPQQLCNKGLQHSLALRLGRIDHGLVWHNRVLGVNRAHYLHEEKNSGLWDPDNSVVLTGSESSNFGVAG